jgi:transcriptional regulator with XRE-family HTH domain
MTRQYAQIATSPATRALAEAGVTQAELARRLGMAQPAISLALNGHRNVPERLVGAVMALTGLPREEIVPERRPKGGGS